MAREEELDQRRAYLLDRMVGRSLHLRGVSDLDLDLLGSLPDFSRITLLELHDLHATRLAPLKGLSQLEELLLIGSEGIMDYPYLADMASLRFLELSACHGFKTLGFLSHAAHLTKVALLRCPELATLDGLEECPSLRSVYLAECEKLTSLGAVRGLALRQFTARNCPQIRDLSPLFEVSTLRHVNVSCVQGGGGFPAQQIEEMKQVLPKCRIHAIPASAKGRRTIWRSIAGVASRLRRVMARIREGR